MKKLFILAFLISLTAYTAISQTTERAYNGSVFSDVWSKVSQDKYRGLPQNEVTISSFGGWLNTKLSQAASRTINNRADTLPRFQKLVHPNGICFAGKWIIDEKTKYTGYFAEGSEALIIARASVALSDTKKGSRRAFGMAGKLFPTAIRTHSTPLKTGNFFVVDDLGGTKRSSFITAPLVNNPPVTLSGTSFTEKAIGAITGLIFNNTDKSPGVRQLYEISELGMSNPKKAVTPKFMRITGSEDNQKFASKSDFRDDLRLENYNGDLTFNIYVSNGSRSWKRIGRIEFDEDAASDSCDHRLHFHHPKTK
jgi:hypothetical protein